MECTVIEGETSDTIEFTRPGVNGRLVVAPVSTTKDTDYEAEGGVRFAFLPRKVGRADIEVVVDGQVAEVISLTVSPQR